MTLRPTWPMEAILQQRLSDHVCLHDGCRLFPQRLMLSMCFTWKICQAAGTWSASVKYWREADLSRHERRKNQARSHPAPGSAALGTKPLRQQAVSADAAEE